MFKAIKVTEDNFNYVDGHARDRGFELDLRDNWNFAKETLKQETIYVVKEVTPEDTTTNMFADLRKDILITHDFPEYESEWIWSELTRKPL